MDNRPPVNNGGRRRKVTAAAAAQCVQSIKDNGIGIRHFALCEIEGVEAVQQLAELFVDFIKRQCAVNTQFFRCSILAETAAEPDFRRQITNPVKQNTVVMGFITFNQYQYGFRLTETGQVEKITVLAVGILTVRIALCRRCRKENRRAGRCHFSSNA